MKINHNIPALRTLNQLNKVNDKSSKTMLRLSSGLRINSAADDAAGLAISQKMDTQIRGLRQANRNAMDGISMIQTAEGAYNEIHAMLQRMRELTVQGANGTYNDSDRLAIQDEMLALQDEILAIQKRTEFNKKTLLDGSQNRFMLQIGANQNQSMEIFGTDMNLDDVLTNIYGINTATSDINIGELPGGTTINVNGTITTIGPNPPDVTSFQVPPDTLVVIKMPGGAGTTVNGVEIKPGEKLSIRTGNEMVNLNSGSGAPVTYTTTLRKGTGASAILPNTDIKEFDIGSTAGTMDQLPVGTTITVNGITSVLGATAPASAINAPAGAAVVIKLPKNSAAVAINGGTGTDILAGTTIKGDEEVTFKLSSAATFSSNAAANLGANTKVILPNTSNKTFIDLSDPEVAGKTLVQLDKAIETTSKIRGKLGAYQNRLEHTVSNLAVSEENLTASLSRIQDADMALEMSTYTQQDILSQAATAMLAQANQRPQQILQLLQR